VESAEWRRHLWRGDGALITAVFAAVPAFYDPRHRSCPDGYLDPPTTIDRFIHQHHHPPTTLPLHCLYSPLHFLQPRPYRLFVFAIPSHLSGLPLLLVLSVTHSAAHHSVSTIHARHQLLSTISYCVVPTLPFPSCFPAPWRPSQTRSAGSRATAPPVPLLPPPAATVPAPTRPHRPSTAISDDTWHTQRHATRAWKAAEGTTLHPDLQRTTLGSLYRMRLEPL
jgi:hypothetical protein